jgi:hypothetical protein
MTEDIVFDLSTLNLFITGIWFAFIHFAGKGKGSITKQQS